MINSGVLPPLADSPCIRRCSLDDDDICLGCFRTLVEITGWHDANSREREAILIKANRRHVRYRQCT